MSQVSEMSSGMSSGSSGVRRVYCDGIPKKCGVCDGNVRILISKSQANPNRKYFRCEYAAAHKLVDDNHLFKWINVAVDEEVLKMSVAVEILEKEVAEIKARSVEVQKMVIEKMEEQTKKVKMACGVVFVGCLLMVVMIKLF